MYWSHMSTIRTDGKVHKKLLPMHPETMTRRKKRRNKIENRKVIAELSAFYANALINHSQNSETQIK